MIMPRPKEFRDIPFSQLEMGPTSKIDHPADLEFGLGQLINSIKKFGLLQPVVVCELPNGKYELIAGRRRVLAAVQLQATFIKAVVLDQRPDPPVADAIWATENLVRQEVSSGEAVAAFEALFKKFGSAAEIAEQTGIPLTTIQKYVR